MRAPTGLRQLWAAARFRRLLTVRLVSQFGDGLFQAGLAWLVLLSPERQHTPAAVATAAAVILLPFSVVGPFTGVFLDRWSRRQVLLYGEAARVVLVGTLVGVGASSQPGFAHYGLAIACLGVNRFLLSALSAGLPHVVPGRLLVTANAAAPTAGTILTLTGVASGGLVLLLDHGGSRSVLVCACVAFGGAGLLALRLRRPELGPDLGSRLTRPPTSRALAGVGADLAAGLRHLGSRPPAVSTLLAFASYRFWYGLWTVQAVMLTVGAVTGDLSTAVLVAAASGAGFVAAVFACPFGLRRVRLRRWLVGTLLLAAGAVALTAVARGVVALSLTGFLLGLVAQSTKICTDTTLQRRLDDDHRGRAFAVYDMAFNASFVAATALSVLLVPDSGDSRLAPLLCAAGLGLTAVAYASRTADASGR